MEIAGLLRYKVLQSQAWMWIWMHLQKLKIRMHQSGTAANGSASAPPSNCTVQREVSNNAWLWTDHMLSDVTVELQNLNADESSPSSIPNLGPKIPGAVLHEGISKLEPLQSMCSSIKTLCSCPHSLQSTIPPHSLQSIIPPLPPAPGDSTNIAEQRVSVSVLVPDSFPVSLLIPRITLSFKLHAVILSSASGYFRTLFARSKTSSMSGWCPQCKVTQQILEGRELEAAEHVLKFIYTLEVPTDGGLVSDGMLVLWMIQVPVGVPAWEHEWAMYTGGQVKSFTEGNDFTVVNTRSSAASMHECCR